MVLDNSLHQLSRPPAQSNQPQVRSLLTKKISKSQQPIWKEGLMRGSPRETLMRSSKSSKAPIFRHSKVSLVASGTDKYTIAVIWSCSFSLSGRSLPSAKPLTSSHWQSRKIHCRLTTTWSRPTILFKTASVLCPWISQPRMKWHFSLVLAIWSRMMWISGIQQI